MKLELKHLAPYLPYKLQIGSCHSHDEKRTYSELKLVNDYGLSNGVGDLINGKTTWGTPIKPILRPLSDLRKDKFKDVVFPISNYTLKNREQNRNLDVSQVVLQSLTNQSVTFYSTVEKLFELHFDVFGLIDKGLAIDINTLNN